MITDWLAITEMSMVVLAGAERGLGVTVMNVDALLVAIAVVPGSETMRPGATGPTELSDEAPNVPPAGGTAPPIGPTPDESGPATLP
jgi:hypothetical protein